MDEVLFSLHMAHCESDDGFACDDAHEHASIIHNWHKVLVHDPLKHGCDWFITRYRWIPTQA